MLRFLKNKYLKHFLAFSGVFVLGFLIFLSLFFNFTYANRILPHISVGSIDVGGLTVQEAIKKLNQANDRLFDQGIVIVVGNDTEIIRPENIHLYVNIEKTVEAAVALGHRNHWYNKFIERLLIPLGAINLPPEITFSDQAVQKEIDSIADLIDTPREDIRLRVQGVQVAVLTDVKSGKIIDRQYIHQAVVQRLTDLDNTKINVSLRDDIPRATLVSAQVAKKEAERILSGPLTLKYQDKLFYISPEKIGSWIVSDYDDAKVIPGFDKKAIGAYLTDVASKINIPPQKPRLVRENNKIVEFVPPATGIALEEDKTLKKIIQNLDQRRFKNNLPVEIDLSVKIVKSGFEGNNNLEGVVELIGKATTPFTHSPANRIHNIDNGIKFLSGKVVGPGEEFSTLNSLGEIDNAAGYLPELVIRGDKTTPEFGGGLCQVSTTLFRAILNAGLPVTERRNHSYRVSYYEKDGQGNFIGPGLDATIYDPDVDLKFKNDTNAPVLIYGYLTGDKVTFELYGAKDGRTAEVVGPRMLSEVPSGDPIYVETDTLAKGSRKQIETAHPGGSAVATYIIIYANGKKVKQDFWSYYRRWPARFLVGVR